MPLVADFDSLDALIAHAEGEGASHVVVAGTRSRLYYPLNNGQYESSGVWQRAGYWHSHARGNRRIVEGLPRDAQPIRFGRVQPIREGGPMIARDQRLDSFTRSYIETALWSSMDNANDQGGEPLDENYGPDDIDPETMAQMITDCTSFQERNAELLSDSGLADKRAGHYFWLSRNRHGSGFFDENLDALQDAARAYGEFDLYVGDGVIYGSPLGTRGGVNEARRVREVRPSGSRAGEARPRLSPGPIRRPSGGPPTAPTRSAHRPTTVRRRAR
jgi:hypothetical protein